MDVGVVGTGHVGLVVAACLAEMGHQVVGVDLPRVVRQVERGSVPFHEPGLTEMVKASTRSGRLRMATCLDAVAESRVIWIALPTTGSAQGTIRVDKLERTVARLGDIAGPSAVLAIKSTIPVGTCRRLAGYLTDCGPRLVYSPEFLRQGSAIEDFFNPGKIVFGVGPKGGVDVVDSMLTEFSAFRLHTDWETAEGLKLAANAFHALRVSFINELALTFEGLGVSTGAISEALRSDVPDLSRYLQPGFGYGGSCLPNNVAYLARLARSRGHPAPLWRGVMSVNRLRIQQVVSRLRASLGSLAGHAVALWGMTYKAGTDDLRESPSLWLATALRQEGATVKAYDPRASADALRRFGCTPYDSPRASLEGASALVALVRHAEFAAVPVAELLRAVPLGRIIDVVGAVPQLSLATTTSPDGFFVTPAPVRVDSGRTAERFQSDVDEHHAGSLH